MSSKNGNSRPKLAAVVITHNEESNIARCLESLHFCDEIVVLDSQSTDRTVVTAQKFTPKVFQQAWQGYVAQKNAAVGMSTCEWILSIDADEAVTPELRDQILSELDRGPEFGAYSFPRKTIHMGRWIRYGGWYPNRLVRLFDRRRGKWNGGELHEYWDGSGAVGLLSADLLHYSFKDLEDQVQRNNRYSTLGAVNLHRSGRSFSALRLISKTLTKFIETYFLKRGFLDGYPGFIISVSAAYSVFLKWAKLWELERSEKTLG